MIQCLIPSAVTSLGSPAKLLSLALGRSQRLDQRVTKVRTRREQSRRVFICRSRCAIARRGCPESIRPVVVMDSGLARACHRAAQSADPLARPGMTALGNCFARFQVFGRTHGAYGALRIPVDLLSRINVICPVQSCLQKYSAFAVGQITTTTAASCPTEGVAQRHQRGAGCGGRGRRF